MNDDDDDEKYSTEDQTNDDFVFSRDKYYKLAESGQEAIDLMLNLARESEAPRAFEVLATLIKSNAEIVDRLMDLQKKKKDILKKETTSIATVPKIENAPSGSGGITNNNLFVGSTQELSKMIEERKEALRNKQNTIEEDED
jgi:hypothetical protein